MEPARWDQLQLLFHHALPLADEERLNFLAQSCSDPQMRGEVERMIEENQRQTSILDRGLREIAVRLIGGTSRPIPANDFGPYRLLAFIGEGGMGSVYLAERKDTGKKVAVKFLIGAGMSPARQQRFMREIRMHAKLSHPYIAAQYDAATLPDGTPLFVMEYVEGQHLLDYCRQHLSSLEQRLHLFRSICEAIEYLHGKAIIHRDIKPSNILVDGSGTPRVLDFGIAKELDDANETQTQPELRFMTEKYAAPEWKQEGIVDRSTDVYALGVLLSEMIAGLPGIGAARQKELDKVCSAAQQVDSDKRYRSVEALTRDVDHFIRNEPLETQPPTLTYRFERFVARNRRSVIAVTLTSLAFAGMAVFFTWRLAVERNSALAESARLARLQSFMVNMLGARDRAAGPSSDLRVVALLDLASEDASRLNDDPHTQAELFQTLGRMYRLLGEFQKSDSHLKLAVSKFGYAGAAESLQLADTLVDIGLLRGDQEKYREAEQSVQHGLNLISSHLETGDPRRVRAETAFGRVLAQSGAYERAAQILQPLARLTPRTGESAYAQSEALSTLAFARNGAGDYDGTRSTIGKVISLDRGLYGASHPRIASELAELAAADVTQGHYLQGEAEYRQAVAISDKWYGSSHPETLQHMTSLAAVLIQQSKRDEAKALLQHVLTVEEQSKERPHTYYAWAQDTFGRLELLSGKFAEAELHFRRALDLDQIAFGESDHQTAMVKAHLAQALIKLNHYPEAEPLLEQSLRSLEDRAPKGNMSVSVIEVLLGQVLVRLGRFSEAEPKLLAGFAALKDQHAQPLLKSREDALENLALISIASGHPSQARDYRNQMLTRAR